MQIRCADCECSPTECEGSRSASECPKCKWEKCCCWNAINI